MKIGIIGYGSMGKMLLWKFKNNANIDKTNLYISNRTIEKLDEVKDIANVTSNIEVAKNADILFLCIRPTSFKEVLSEIKDEIKKDTLVVSLNGSITFNTLSKYLNNGLAKAIPSITAEIDRSQTLVSFNGLVNSSKKEELKSILNSFGKVIELEENELGMASELVSCMPGFISSIFDCICLEAKKHTNIDEKDIIKMVLDTINATTELMIKNNLSFNDVVNRVATKGGITIEGTNVIYESFPSVANDLFNKTLEKRQLTKEKIEESFNE